MRADTEQPKPPSPSWQKTLQDASAYAGLGMQLALSMAFFVVAGYLLDRWLATDPWLLVAGAVIGMVAIFVQLFRVVAEMNRRSAAQRKQKDEADDA